jgi:hypothetical protein
VSATLPGDADEWLHPLTARSALAKWDAGDSLFTIEMGGLGPGYEQAIHVAVMETIRILLECDCENRFQLAREADRKPALDAVDTALMEANRSQGLRLSGAQAGAAKSLVYHVMWDGWRVTMLAMKNKDGDRMIQISKAFP